MSAQPLTITLSEEVLEAIVERVKADLVLNTPAANEPWVGVGQAAQHLGCKRQRIYDLVSRRDESRIPHRRDGTRLLFRLSQLDRWLGAGG